MLLAGVVLSASAIPAAGEEEMPEMDFLEYLGMWEESDEDWQLFEEETAAGKETRSDPAPDGKESQENEDES